MFIYRGARPRLNRTARDTGTPELMRKRADLVRGGDPVMSTTPLGVYLERGFLHESYDQARKMYDAGMNYRYLYGTVFGRSSVKAITDMPSGPKHVDDELLEDIEPEYWRAARVLMKERPVFNATWRVCIHDQFVGAWELEKLRTGLCRLMRA